MKRISGRQLFAITFLFQIGTSIIFGFGGEAGRDAWVGALASCGLGVFIVLIDTTLMKLNPGLTVVEWFPTQFGRWLGLPVAFVYPLMWVYIAGRIFGDIRDMVSTTLLPSTPLLAITGLFAVLTAYLVYGGIENVARVGEILFPAFVVGLIIMVTLLFFSGVIDIHQMQPILEDGLHPIWDTAIPSGITQTYGEIIIFSMFWNEIEYRKDIPKITITSTVITGFTIAILDLLAVLVFGGAAFSRFLYPMYSLLEMVSLGEFIDNLQILGLFFFMSTALIKTVIYILAAVKGIQTLTHMGGYHRLIIPSVIIAMYLGMIMSKNVVEHIYVHHFKILVPYVWLPLLLVLPTVLLIVTWLRQKVGTQK